MPKVTYLGPHDEITFPDHGITVARGDSVDVSDALADELVARENGTSWELVEGGVAAVVEVPAPDNDAVIAVQNDAVLVGAAPKSTKGRAAADKES